MRGDIDFVAFVQVGCVTMLRIRMMRFGRKRQPSYRVVVLPRGTKSGRSKYVESLGWVDPLAHKSEINKERASYWLGVGAQPSDTVWNLFVREGIVDGKKRKKGKAGITKEVEEETGESGGEAVATDATESPAEEKAEEKQEEQGDAGEAAKDEDTDKPEEKKEDE